MFPQVVVFFSSGSSDIDEIELEANEQDGSPREGLLALFVSSTTRIFLCYNIVARRGPLFL